VRASRRGRPGTNTVEHATAAADARAFDLGLESASVDAQPQLRHAVRVLLVDESDRVLLLRAVNPETGVVFWFSPGGGLEPGEDVRSTVRRELGEELGRPDIELDAEVWQRRHVFSWRHTRYDQRERWFFARVAHFEPDTSGMTETEQADLSGWRWWTLDELAWTPDRLTPRDLARHLSDLLRDGPPTQPITVGV
jgi:ADP-ribose pyrophosphatase YjhB (NUDIX family)